MDKHDDDYISAWRDAGQHPVEINIIEVVPPGGEATGAGDTTEEVTAAGPVPGTGDGSAAADYAESWRANAD
jgi:hypothetical protein